MPPVPQSSSTPANAQAIADAEAGLAAFKQADYPRAIALLETTGLPSRHPLYVKAQMGLIVAYARNGDPQRALSLCQALEAYDQSTVQAWARRTRASILKRHPQLGQIHPSPMPTAEQMGDDLTGFVPLEPESEGVLEKSGDRGSADLSVRSGFTPLEPDSELLPSPASARCVPTERDIPPAAPLETSLPTVEAAAGASTPMPPTPAEATSTGLVPVYQPHWRQSGRAQRWQPLRKAKSSNPMQGVAALALLWFFLRVLQVDQVSLGTVTIPLHSPLLEAGMVLVLLWEFALGKVNETRLFLQQLVTAIALFALIREVLYQVPNLYHSTLSRIPWLNHSYELMSRPTLSVLTVLLIGFIGSRWWLDGLLWLTHGMRPAQWREVGQYSPETERSLPIFCRKRHLPLPALGILPMEAPVILSYGCLPRLTRIVVSQGLLERLADDEIASLFAAEVGHMGHGTVPLMSLVMVVLQIPYTLYWVASEWSSRQMHPLAEQLLTRLESMPWVQRINQKLMDQSGARPRPRVQPGWVRWLDEALRDGAVLVAAIAYGLYRLLRYVPLWLSRQRLYFSDRTAAELTGNPNGLTRALLKSAVYTAESVQAQGKTPYLLEGFDLLMPLGHQQAITLGSLYPHTAFPPVLEWDWSNPYRFWLSLNNAHPPTGDRLRLQALYAQYWRLENELELSSAQLSTPRKALTATQWQRLLLQGAPFFGLGTGILLVLILSWIGYLAGVFDSAQPLTDEAIVPSLESLARGNVPTPPPIPRTNLSWLSWLQSDPSLQLGLPLIGFSVGTFLRINAFFPDIPFFGRANLAHSSAAIGDLPKLLTRPGKIPLDAEPVQLSGRLIGRPKVGNYLSQDLLLHTEKGLIRLHCLDAWGPVGNLLHRGQFTTLCNQEVTLSGWLRRGNVPWIDVETIRAANGRKHVSQHPIWSAIVASVAALWGILQIALGGGSF